MDRGQLPKVSHGSLDEAGQELLDDILTDPRTVRSTVRGGNFPGGTRFVGPNHIGVTFDANGNFQYFGIYP